MVIAHFLFQSSDGFKTASEFLSSNPIVQNHVGDKISSSMAISGNHIRDEGSNGEAIYAINLKGNKSAGRAQVWASKLNGKWIVDKAEIEFEDGKVVQLK